MHVFIILLLLVIIIMLGLARFDSDTIISLLRDIRTEIYDMTDPQK